MYGHCEICGQRYGRDPESGEELTPCQHIKSKYELIRKKTHKMKRMSKLDGLEENKWCPNCGSDQRTIRTIYVKSATDSHTTYICRQCQTTYTKYKMDNEQHLQEYLKQAQIIGPQMVDSFCKTIKEECPELCCNNDLDKDINQIIVLFTEECISIGRVKEKIKQLINKYRSSKGKHKMNYEIYKKAEKLQLKITLLNNQMESLKTIKEIHLIRDNREIISIDQLKKSVNDSECASSINLQAHTFIDGLHDSINKLIAAYTAEFEKL